MGKHAEYGRMVMSEPIETQQKEDVTVTNKLRVVCDGPATGRHPRVYLTMVDDAHGHPDHVVCPYCSHVFRYQAAPGAGPEGHA